MASNHSLQEETQTAAPSTPVTRIQYGRLWWAGLVAAIAAAVANLVVFVVARDWLGIPLMASPTPDSTEMAPLSAMMVIIASAVPAIAATVLLAMLNKFLEHPLRIFWIVSVLFLLISFTGPLSLPVGIATKVTLSLMHVIAAVVIIGLLTVLPVAEIPGSGVDET